MQTTPKRNAAGNSSPAVLSSTPTSQYLSRRKNLARRLFGCLAALALPLAAAGSVQLDGLVSTNAVTSNTSSNTVSLAHITGTGSNRLTLVGISWNANTSARTLASVAFTPVGGTATNLTLVRSQISASTTYRYAAIYALTNPPSGQSGTFLATFTGSVANGIAIGAANFAGVNPATPLGVSSGAGAASGASITTSLTGLSGNELIFDTIFVGGTPPPPPVPNSGQTTLWNTNISNARGVASSTPAASSSFTDSWTSGDSTRPWAIVAVPINPAIDTTPPSVTINQAVGQADPTTNQPVNFTVVFSKPVTNFASGGVTIGGTAGATTASVTGSGTNYNVAVSGIAHSGTVIASIAAGVANDTAGNPNTASTSTDNTVAFVYVPAITIFTSASANPAGYLGNLTFTATIQTNGVAVGDAGGNVVFSANGTPFSTNAVVGGSATSGSINSLPRGTNNQIAAAYSGDGYYPGSSGSLVEVVTNHPPVAQPIAITRAANSSLQISLASLSANWSDADGDTVSLAGVNLTTANGVTVQTNGGFIIYPNAANVADQISYTVSDGIGGTSVGVINIQISTDADSLLLTSSAQTSGFLDAVTFTAQVQTNGTTAGDATGNVVFSANGSPFSTNAVSGGISASDGISSLPRGTANIITAVYSGDGVYKSNTSSLVQAVTNHPPVATNVSYGRDAASSVVTIAVSNLLSNVADADGDTISLVSLGTPVNGGFVANQSGTLIYSNAAIVNDQFTYTVADGFGGTNTAQASIVVTNVITVLALSSSEPASGFQDSLTFTATLQTNGVTAGDATNIVVFSANGTPFSTNALVAGTIFSGAINSLPRGTNLITAAYAGDNIYPALTNNFSEVVTNHPPVAQPVTAARLAGTSVQIALSDLATNWSDADGDTVSLAGVNLTSTNGVTVQTNGTFIIYPSAANVPDQISYTIGDGFDTSVGLINIGIVKNPTTLALASSSPVSGYLSGVNFTASVQTNGVTAGNATGSMVFQANGVAFSTNNVSAGNATSANISSLPRGTGNVITATYSGDSAYSSGANAFNQTVTNHPPVAGAATYSRSGSNSLTIAVSDLLGNVADADGDAISLVSVGTSTNGITLGNNGSSLVYNNPNPVADQFAYTVADGNGGTSSGTVNISEKPVFAHHNILLMIADDLGADGLSLFNTNASASIPYTPNLTALGQSGVVFTHFYARPSCSQSRACIITGRDSFRTGVGCAISGSTTPSLRTNEYTLPRAFATNAPQYGLASFGKYHLSVTTDLNSPWTTAGWSNFAGFFSPQVSSYFNWTKISNGVSFTSTAYTTSEQVNDATNFIARQGTNRWFVWLAFNAPHQPRHLPPTNLLVSAKYLALSGTAGDISANPRSYWEAMVQAEDTEIGRLLKVVDTNDTDIIFLGDNGSEADVQQFPYKNAAVPATTSGNGHAKFTIYEGGSRTPLFITGPDVGSPGRYNDSLVNEPDLWSTIQELAGINVAATTPTNIIIDSVSLLPAIKADVFRPTPWVIEEQFNEGTAADGVTLRNDRFKFIHFYNHVEQFYDLQSDPYEYTNLLASPPLSPVAQSNYNAVKLKLGEYQTFANTAYTRNLVSYPQISNAGYTNGTFNVKALFTQLSANGSFANPNQPGLTQFAASGTNLNYQVILWRNADLGNPLGWVPVATNLATGITNNFLLSTNGWLIDANASADHNFYRISPYIP